MANGCYLVTLWLDTALIDNVGRGGVVGEVVLPPCVPIGPARTPWSSTSECGLAPCRARLPSNGGLFLDDILLLLLDLGPSDLHVGTSKLLVP